MNLDVDRLLNIDEFPADWFAEGIVRVGDRPDMRCSCGFVHDFGFIKTKPRAPRNLISVSPPYRVEE